MDQNSSNGTDKRSWRERLGIGTGKDMPRIADEFTPTAPPPAARAPAVKPAPMAPRPGVKAAPPRGTPAAAPAGAAGEKLAEKLKAQREAQERLAEQRVQAARSRAEVKPSENGNGAKPKFTFAVDEAEQAKPAAAPAAPPPARPAMQVPVPPLPAPGAAASPAAKAPPMGRTMAPPPSMTPAPMTPPRTPLGAERPMMPPRPAGTIAPPVVPTRPQSRYSPPPAGGYAPSSGYGSQMPPPYRPIDPASRGYSAGGYQPPPAYTPPPMGNYGSQPRLNMPAQAPAGPGFGNDSFETRGRGMRPPPRPAVGGYRADEFQESDVFSDTRATRRATAGDYSQAYRDEQAYEDELPPSRGPLLPLMLLFLLALAAGLGLWWVYQSSQDKNVAAGQSGSTPVVQAPAQPAKVTPDPAPQQNAPPKKLIYDRIVGDREVLGGDVIQSEEVPAQPGDSTNLQQGVDPAAAGDAGTQGGAAAPASGGQEELVPLPLPPPPGDTGAGDQQGALPGDKTSNQAMINPAAGASQAAETSLAATGKSDPEGINSSAKQDPAAAAVPAEAVAPVPPEPAPVPGEAESAAATGSETIADPDPAPAPVKKKPEAKKVAEKKPVKTEKSLGSKPVVLVPPSSKAKAAAEQDVASIETGNGTASVASGNGGLYDGDAVVTPPAGSNAAAPAPAPVKRKRTIADLFRSEDSADEPAPAPVQQQASTPAAKATQPVQQVTPQPAPQPAPQQQASTGGSGYVAQLASFATQAEATKEYGRLKAKHGAVFAGLSPIVSQAVVGGSTRYRLAVGVMGSREQASAVCSKLFAGGERDCLVRRQ